MGRNDRLCQQRLSTCAQIEQAILEQELLWGEVLGTGRDHLVVGTTLHALHHTFLITGWTGVASLFDLLFQFALAPKFGLLDFQDLLGIEILSEPSDQDEGRWFRFGRGWRWSQYIWMKADYHVS